jgi:hypothetical protein
MPIHSSAVTSVVVVVHHFVLIYQVLMILYFQSAHLLQLDLWEQDAIRISLNVLSDHAILVKSTAITWLKNRKKFDIKNYLNKFCLSCSCRLNLHRRCLLSENVMMILVYIWYTLCLFYQWHTFRALTIVLVLLDKGKKTV